MNKLILLTTVFFLAVFTVGLSANSSSAATANTNSNSPVTTVTTSQELIDALIANVDIILADDIDMYNAAPATAPITVVYSATLDGNGKTVSNHALDLTSTTTNDTTGAFIGALTSTGVVKNITFYNISSKLSVANDNGGTHGVIIGSVAGTIDNVAVDRSSMNVGPNITNISAVGILAGNLVGSGSITNTDIYLAIINVDDSSKVNIIGGLVGYQAPGTEINNVKVTGAIVAEASNAIGGLAGQSESLITNSMAAVNIVGNLRLGGLVGVAEAGAVITNNFTSGDIQSKNLASSTI